MPLPEDRFSSRDPGRFKQLKLHEMALGYAGALYARLCMLAAELAEALGRKMNAADWDAVAWARYFRLSLGETLQAVLAEQRGDSASPFIEAVYAAFTEDLSSARSSYGGSPEPQAEEFRSFAEFLAERRAPAPTGDPAHLAAAASIIEARIGELLALADLRTVEDVCEELLTAIFRWDGRRFAISGQRAAETQGLIERYLKAHSGERPPEDPKTAKGAIKLALTMLYFWRRPAPSALAKLQACYTALEAQSRSKPFNRMAGPGEKRPQPSLSGRDDMPGSARRDLAEEIETFCRTLAVLREAIGVF